MTIIYSATKNYTLHQKLYGDGIAYYNNSPRQKKMSCLEYGCLSFWEINVLTFWSSGMLTRKQA